MSWGLHVKTQLEILRELHKETTEAVLELLDFEENHEKFTGKTRDILRKQAYSRVRESLLRSEQFFSLTPAQVTTYLANSWELGTEPSKKESIRALVTVLTEEDESGRSLMDNYDVGTEREAVEELLRRVSRNLAGEGYDNEERAALDFQMLFGVVSSFARPGWCVALTLMDNGELGYAHRPMSTDEIFAHLLATEGADSVLKQIVDFIDLYENGEQFRHFFFGPNSY